MLHAENLSRCPHGMMLAVCQVGEWLGQELVLHQDPRRACIKEGLRITWKHVMQACRNR